MKDEMNITEAVGVMPMIVVTLPIVVFLGWLFSLFDKSDPVNNEDYRAWKKRNKHLYRA